MTAWNINGCCERCGFRYKGAVDEHAVGVMCPNCAVANGNFDNKPEIEACKGGLPRKR